MTYTTTLTARRADLDALLARPAIERAAALVATGLLERRDNRFHDAGVDAMLGSDSRYTLAIKSNPVRTDATVWAETRADALLRSFNHEHDFALAHYVGEASQVAA